MLDRRSLFAAAAAGVRPGDTPAAGNLDTGPSWVAPTCTGQQTLHDAGIHRHVPPVTAPGPG